MIKIKDTPNMIGITIHGDYEDLRALYNSISDYLRFYFDHTNEPGAYSCYETILGLCYDIRHAFQGDRNIERVDNNSESIGVAASCIYEIDEDEFENERKKYKNGNLYFNVEVLYPWAIYYLFTLHTVIEDYYHKDWFEDDEYGYTPYQAEADRAMIDYFVQLLWGKMREHLPENVMKELWEYKRAFNHKDYYFTYPDLYMEWICTYWVSVAKNRNDRIKLLPLLCLELSGIDEEYENEWEDYITDENGNPIPKFVKAENLSEMSDEERKEYSTKLAESIDAEIARNVLNTLNIYDQYSSKYEDELEKPFIDMYFFLEEIDGYVHDHGPFTDDSFDEWLDENVGKVDWYQLDW